MLRAATFLLVLGGLCAVGQTAAAIEVPGCGSTTNGYGPYDYRDYTNRQRFLPIVEAFHFTQEVRSLTHGKSGTILGDIDYTLRAFPNHAAALDAVSRYGLRGGSFGTDGVASVECYFLRAVAFTPTDQTVRVLYANYLNKSGNKSEARSQYEEALRLAPDSPEINYNAALYFLNDGNLARAHQLADVAYKNGYPLPGLKNRLAAADAKKP